MLAQLRTVPVATIALAAAMPLTVLPAQGDNVAKVTVGSGPDQGTYTMEVPAHGMRACGFPIRR
jgi:hypothetical protein